MADAQILATGSADAPEGYTVPNTVELIPKAVSAIFDGTGASGDFIPLLEIVSDGGIVVAQSPGSTVTAGGSVEQSWFPWLSGGGSSGSLTPDWGTYFIDSVTVGPGSQTTSTWHANSGSALLTIPAIGSPSFVSRGVYTVTCWVQSVSVWTAGGAAGGYLSFGSPTSFEARASGTADATGTLQTFEVTLTAQADAGATVELAFANQDSASRDLYSNQVLVQQVYSF